MMVDAIFVVEDLLPKVAGQLAVSGFFLVNPILVVLFGGVWFG